MICWLFERIGRTVLVTTLFHTAFNLVATVYFMAAMDLSVTRAIGATALAIWLFDRRPASAGKNPRKSGISGVDARYPHTYIAPPSRQAVGPVFADTLLEACEDFVWRDPALVPGPPPLGASPKSGRALFMLCEPRTRKEERDACRRSTN